MKSYKGWTKEQRLASLKLTKQAIADGIIPHQNELGCNRCGQKEGIIHYHNHDYSDPIKFLESLCWRCHMVHHSAHRAPEMCIKYWEDILRGRQYKPVTRHDFNILKEDHNIS